MDGLMEARDLVSLCWNVEYGLGIGGRIVVIRQFDFQANQLSQLHLHGRRGVCVCVFMKERVNGGSVCTSLWREFKCACVCSEGWRRRVGLGGGGRVRRNPSRVFHS